MHSSPHRLEVTDSARRVLSSAAERVRKRIDEVYSPLAPGGTERATAYLDTLVAKLQEVVGGKDPESMREWVSSSPLSQPLLDALWQELIVGGSDPDSEPGAIAALRAWTGIRGAPTVAAAATSSPSDDLRKRMHAPDAFDLLVEVAHDFRSPLTSILFLAEALRDGHSGELTDLQRSQLGLIYSAAFGLASIASDVMDLARREKDLIDDAPEPFLISEVYGRVERMVRPLVEEKGLELRMVVPERWQAKGHPHALSRVLLNLTTNALKFTDEGSVELGVKAMPHGRLEYYVQDTGRGISPESQRSLFQPFRHRSSDPKDGHYFSSAGIGLSIARRLLRAMDSDLSLDYSGDRGTRFSFVLPRDGHR